MTNKQKDDLLRSQAVKEIFDFLVHEKFPMMIKNNVITYAVRDEEDTLRWVSIMVQVPRGTKEEPFDGEALAEDFELETKLKEEKKKSKADLKAKKIEADKKLRKIQAEQEK